MSSLKDPSELHLCFVYMKEFGYYILIGACRNEGNHCETTKVKIIQYIFRTTTYSKTIRHYLGYFKKIFCLNRASVFAATCTTNRD